MKLELYNKVKIKDKDVIGIIVDINGENDKTVESETKEHKQGAYGGEWPLYFCNADDLVIIKD